MVVSTEEIQKLCRTVAKEIGRAYSDLHLHFVVHQTGTLRDSIALAEHEILSHPAAESAHSILRKQVQTDNSSFIGLAISSKSGLLGFKREDKVLGLFTVNADQFNSMHDAEMQIYQMAWHAIDLHEIRKTPIYQKKFPSGAMIPKRSALNLSKSHLQADAFVCIFKALNGDNSFTKKMGVRRALQSLSPTSNFKAEDFPFVIAMESCEIAIAEATHSVTTLENKIAAARRISIDVGHAFDEQSIKQWWDYCLPAQDMAWRGITQEEILGAALNTSDNPFVRSIALLIDEITNLNPAGSDEIAKIYNAFVDPDTILDLHRDLINEVFEDAITQGLKDSSPEAFMEAANKQNESLTEGNILGWCANALQNAGKAFENALRDGTAPDQAARVTFKTDDKSTSWDSLKDLGKKIVDEKKEGFAITMGHIAEICHNNPAFSQVLDSIKITMNDPSYLQSLQAANDLNFVPGGPAVNAPAPKGPAPNAPGPKGPALSGPTATPAPVSAPGMGGPGGGNRNAQIMHQKRMLAEKQRQEQASQGNRDNSDKE